MNKIKAPKKPLTEEELKKFREMGIRLRRAFEAYYERKDDRTSV